MANESSGLWNNLPSIIIVEIFSFLSLKDRLHASSVCKAWRNNLFHPKLWQKVVFQLNSCDNKTINPTNDGVRFLAKQCGRFVQEVVIKVNSSNPKDVQLFQDILKVLTFNNNLRALSIKPQSSRLELSNYRENLSLKQYLECLVKIIKRAHCLQHLSLGCIEELSNLAEFFLEPLAKYQASCLKSLHLSSIKVPGCYSVFNIDCSAFGAFYNLESLSIDYDYVSDHLLDMLSQPHRKPLRRLNIHVHSFVFSVPGVSSSAWKQMKTNNPTLEVSLNLLHFHNLPEDVYDILNEDMPLTHFRVYFSPGFDIRVLDHIAFINNLSLESLILIDALNEDLTAASSFLMYRIDPLIMLAWQCKNLSYIKIIGYEVAADSLIAVSRLRGDQLKVLQIPGCCISTSQLEDSLNVCSEDAMYHLQLEVECALHTPWQPMSLFELPLAVQQENADADGTYLEDLLQDQTW